MIPTEPPKQIDNYTNIIQIITDESKSIAKQILGGYGCGVEASKVLEQWKSLPIHAVVNFGRISFVDTVKNNSKKRVSV